MYLVIVGSSVTDQVADLDKAEKLAHTQLRKHKGRHEQVTIAQVIKVGSQPPPPVPPLEWKTAEEYYGNGDDDDDDGYNHEDDDSNEP